MKKDHDFKELIIKFFAGEIADNELDILKEWLEKDAFNRYIFDQENELWQKTVIKTTCDDSETEKNWLEISGKLGFGGKQSGKPIILNKICYRVLIAAASIAGLVAFGEIIFLLSGKKSIMDVATSSVVYTDEGEKAHVMLSDSTHVFINSGSTLTYSSNYNKDSRVIKLSGEAFFDVHTDSEKPLVVQMNNMTVTATGTRFNVFSYPNEDRIETTLEEGKLHVTINNKIFNMKQGQQVIYYTKRNEALLREVNTETYTSWKENKLRFIDTPFEEVLRKIARRYNVSFIIGDKELLEFKYTATFIDESLEEIMKMLGTVSPISFRIDNRTSADDKYYLKPKITIRKKKV